MPRSGTSALPRWEGGQWGPSVALHWSPKVGHSLVNGRSVLFFGLLLGTSGRHGGRKALPRYAAGVSPSSGDSGLSEPEEEAVGMQHWQAGACRPAERPIWPGRVPGRVPGWGTSHEGAPTQRVLGGVARGPSN